jgi:hypothetical protein
MYEKLAVTIRKIWSCVEYKCGTATRIKYIMNCIIQLIPIYMELYTRKKYA